MCVNSASTVLRGAGDNRCMAEIMWHCRETRQKQRKQISAYSIWRNRPTRQLSTSLLEMPIPYSITSQVINMARIGRVVADPWSSASEHISGQDDALVKVKPLIEITGDWRRFLSGDINDKTAEVIHFHERIGRPLGSGRFIDQLEVKLNRPLKKRKPGPKKENSNN